MNCLLSQFYFNKENKCLSADASELRIPVGSSIPEFINVKSDKTGIINSFLSISRTDEMVCYFSNTTSAVESLIIFNT